MILASAHSAEVESCNTNKQNLKGSISCFCKVIKLKLKLKRPLLTKDVFEYEKKFGTRIRKIKCLLLSSDYLVTGVLKIILVIFSSSDVTF